MELWTEVRSRVLTGELGKRAACQEYKLHWQTLEKILNHTDGVWCKKSADAISRHFTRWNSIERGAKSAKLAH